MNFIDPTAERLRLTIHQLEQVLDEVRHWVSAHPDPAHPGHFRFGCLALTEGCPLFKKWCLDRQQAESRRQSEAAQLAAAEAERLEALEKLKAANEKIARLKPTPLVVPAPPGKTWFPPKVGPPPWIQSPFVPAVEPTVMPGERQIWFVASPDTALSQ